MKMKAFLESTWNSKWHLSPLIFLIFLLAFCQSVRVWEKTQGRKNFEKHLFSTLLCLAYFNSKTSNIQLTWNWGWMGGSGGIKSLALPFPKEGIIILYLLCSFFLSCQEKGKEGERKRNSWEEILTLFTILLQPLKTNININKRKKILSHEEWRWSLLPGLLS